MLTSHYSVLFQLSLILLTSVAKIHKDSMAQVCSVLRACGKCFFSVLVCQFIRFVPCFTSRQLDKPVPLIVFVVIRSPSLGACKQPAFLSRRFHRLIYF